MASNKCFVVALVIAMAVASIDVGEGARQLLQTAVPQVTLPPMPNMPQPSNLPNPAAMPPLPNMPTMPSIPKPAALPPMPNIMASIPKPAGLPPMPNMPSMAAGLPPMPNMPTTLPTSIPSIPFLSSPPSN